MSARRARCAAWCGELSPHSTIVVGGHVAAIPGIEHMLDADHIVKGDGIAWMREYLGEDADRAHSPSRLSIPASTCG